MVGAGVFFTIIDRWAWMFFIALWIYNGLVWRRRADGLEAEYPDQAQALRTIARGYMLFGIPLWVVMGLGILIGGEVSFFSFLHPRHGGPWVHVFLGMDVGVMLLFAWWAFFHDGISTLQKAGLGLRWQAPESGKLPNRRHTLLLVVLILVSNLGVVTAMYAIDWPPVGRAQPPQNEKTDEGPDPPDHSGVRASLPCYSLFSSSLASAWAVHGPPPVRSATGLRGMSI